MPDPSPSDPTPPQTGARVVSVTADAGLISAPPPPRGPLPLPRIHAMLQQAYETMLPIVGRADRLSTDSAMAIGLVLGEISRAKALVGRDIDDANRSIRTAEGYVGPARDGIEARGGLNDTYPGDPYP